MSNHTRNWLKLTVLVGLSFVLGLFFAGLLDLPHSSLAQQDGAGGPPIVPVDAPRIPSAKPLAEISTAYASVVEAVRPSVVFITSERPDGQVLAPHRLPPGFEMPKPRGQAPENDQFEVSSGSGFIVSSDGYIITNHHVIEGASSVKVGLLDGRTFDATVVGSDKDTDVGVLKIDATGLTPAALGSSDGVRVGEWVLAIGNPLGADLTFSVTQGIVSAKGRGVLDRNDPARNQREIADYIQTDAAINRGNSGGPLVNVRGEVIGINSAIASYTGYYAGYAFAIPMDLARNVMNQIIRHGKVVRSALGITVKDADAEDAAYVGLDAVAGVRVDGFGEDSPAKRAGLLPGDVIVAIDGQPMKYTAQLQQAIAFKDPGTTVAVAVARGTGKKEFTVRISAIPNDAEEVAAAPVEKKKPATPNTNRLGITVEPLSAITVRQLGLPNSTKGLLVRSINHGSPAEGKLFSADRDPHADVITEVEGKSVRTEDDLKAALANARNGVVTLMVLNPSSGGITRIERVRVIAK
ncbi:MAG: trypsin-like peptidase domain-containing protein [Gemmatimonadetes bacterium]|nr:trypsin-like peptidase domain-containing protein [Gemmatimonadota bacterium]